MNKALHRAKLALAATAILGMVSCAAFEGRESGGQVIDDTTISTKIRAQYVKDPIVQAMQIHVETMKGTVELSGFVDSKAAETRAVEIARITDGVKDVRDEIVVR
ncbi:MAG: BON domain-containing protein [Alphaproteobacteria bacterium]|nr:BON domain-containing protein [Alphaproteobacteria bacterium]